VPRRLEGATATCGSWRSCTDGAGTSSGSRASLQSYSFSASAGEAVRVSAMKTSGNLQAVAALYGPDGNLLGDTEPYGNGRTNVLSLSAAGTYTWLVYDALAPESSGNYDTSMRFTTGRCAAAITCAEMKSGTLAPGEMQSYSFSASAGEAVRVSAMNTSGNLQAVMALYGPDGRLLGDTEPYGNERTNVLSLSAAGTYTVLVYDALAPDSSGSYNVSIGFTTGRCGTTIACGDTKNAYLAVGEIDTYTFEGLSGTSMALSSARTSGWVSAVIELYDPAGTFLADNGYGNDSTGTVELPSDGTYSVLVFDWGTPSDSGGYSLTRSCAGLPSSFYTVLPCRLVDTRRPAPGSPLQAREDRTFDVVGSCGIPAEAEAVSLNVTATAPTAQGHLRLHPGGSAVPTASTLNYSAGQTRANNAIVALGALGDLAVYSGQGTGTVHVILDVNGYFAP
jgi:hypothetical protein